MKFSLHVLIVIVSSALAIELVSDYKLFLGPQHVVFYQMFMKNDMQTYWALTDEYDKFLQFYKVKDMQKHIIDSVKRYKSLSDPASNKYYGNMTNVNCDPDFDSVTLNP